MKLSKLQERTAQRYVGKRFKVDCGWECIVTAYNGNKDVIVKWQDGSIEGGIHSGNLNKGSHRPKMFPGVVGVGIFDMRGEEYCKDIYWKWASMIKRCYCKKYQNNKPTYKGVEVCEEWKVFSNFSKWAESYSDIKDLELDKDFLGDGKIYSPETCCFIPSYINGLGLQSLSKNKGLSYKKSNRKWEASVSQTTRCGKRVNRYLGLFESEHDARNAYLEGKRGVVLERLNWYRQEGFYDKRVDDAILNSKLFT